MSNDRSVFSFELNEALYFEKGQEVAEMKGISLEPDISIQSFNEYISIRGVIELRGEYQKVLFTNDDGESTEFDDYQSRRYVERVVEIEEGAAEFTHRFPVEISVPTYRVTDLNDVTVYIESFDYEIPDQSQLKLYSTIEIHGINETEEPREEEENQEIEEVSLQREANDTFQFEIKEKEESTNEEESINPANIPVLSTEQEEEATEKDRWKYKETKTLKEFFDNLSSQEEEHFPESYDSPSPSNEIFEESPISPEVNESIESRSEAVEDVSYLSDMFRNSEEEHYTKMRLCIVQEKDTIETIAERYKITTLQLIKQNRLDEDYDVSEGQLLYIPYKK